MKTSGILMVVAAGTLWGTAPLFSKGLFRSGVPSLQVAVVRAMIVCVFYWLIGLKKEKRALLCNFKDAVKIMVTGAASVGIMYLTYPMAMFFFDASLAVVFLYTAPIYVALFMAISGYEKISGTKAIGIVLILCGTILSTGMLERSLHATGIGILAGILCGMSYALVTIFRKTIQASYTVYQVSAYTTTGAVLVLLPFLDFGSISLTVPNGIFFLGSGIISTALPQLLYLMGLDSGVKGSTGSCLAAVELIVAGLCGIFLLGEPTTCMRILGLLIVFFGVVIAAYRNS